MAREFVVSISNSTVISTTTLALILPASGPNPSLDFLRFWVGQNANATSAQQRINIRTQISSWPTCAAFTPKKLKQAEPNASVITGFVSNTLAGAGINATVEGAGTTAILWEDAFNVLNGWLLVPTPPEVINMPSNPPVTVATAMGLEMQFPSTPATLTGWAWGLCFRET
jgi:hypothetical protein